MKKVKIGNGLYEATSLSEYITSPELYNPKHTAIITQDQTTVLPIKSQDDSGPGYYFVGPQYMCAVEQRPQQDEQQQYSADGIIDYDNVDDIRQVIANNQAVKDIQADIMTNSENVLCLNVTGEDTPEMKALKTAINMKQVDKTQYEDRMDQFQNNMRLLKGHKITLGKLVEMCDAFDINARLTLSDRDGAPNPMNSEYNIDLTEGRS